VALDPHRLDAVAEEALTEMLAEGESTNTVASLATWLAASRVREGNFPARAQGNDRCRTADCERCAFDRDNAYC
jgi:hypothetical protein